MLAGDKAIRALFYSACLSSVISSEAKCADEEEQTKDNNESKKHHIRSPRVDKYRVGRRKRNQPKNGPKFGPKHK